MSIAGETAIIDLEKSTSTEIAKDSTLSHVFCESTLSQMKEIGNNNKQSKNDSLPKLDLGEFSTERKIAAPQEKDLGTYNKPEAYWFGKDPEVNLAQLGTKVPFPSEAKAHAPVKFKLVPENNGSGMNCMKASSEGKEWILKSNGWQRISKD